MSGIQIFALVVFLIMFALVITEKIERQWATLLCAAVVIVVIFGIIMKSPSNIMDALAVKNFITPSFWYTAGEGESASGGINWATMIFIAGMMIMVEGMGRAGFFRWLCLKLAKTVHYKVVPLFLTFMIMSFVLAMFIDSITVILFLAAATVELAKLLKFDPVPMIISEIFCANLGGSATMCGDPPNIIIGTSLGYTFTDFITNTGLIALVCLVITIIYFYFAFKKQLVQDDITGIDFPDPGSAIKSKRDFALSTVIFLLAVVLLVTHAQTGLTVATIGLFIGIISLIAAGKDAIILLKKVDYKTLLFFIGLFVVVSGLEKTGVLELIANAIAAASGSNFVIAVAFVIIISAVASAFIDNIPFAATMVPVIQDLATASGGSLHTLAWALAIGTDVGGSATPIGASANVVGISVAAREGHLIGWGKYCKYSAPATAIVIAASLGMIVLRYF